ncbi:NADH-quinone oxidoreductase subunit NuoG [Wohlfahrtiimonas chitiniclastica]|uniref:NADH-quinone oxidoreductase subunit NuoG n=1 Tax=Wohlfahrtiimonas chitiniclastica TaxID=400946 RepID=UPI000382B6D3|nr:NADH-quinone oxidoreductase subunit NuoG [Wohlfahrtiimonas chitiniclastica]
MTEKKMLSIEIDGKKFEAEAGRSVIDVADEVGIPIPRFCYHDKLSIAASCRMCLVDIERMPKPMPACATQIADGMIIRTRNEKARAAQKSVMEFLLINHPLDCPVCDQGGECELQDNSVEFGQKHSTYIEEKRHYEKINIGPLVETYMNRCIQCTRCVRFGEEIAGLRELGGVDRGDRLEITTYVKHSMTSEVSGNIIDLCPVGALTAKPSKFQGRPWEYKDHHSVSIHDGLGTNTAIHTLRGKIARVVSRENEAINQVWIADRDRFSYEANFSVDRTQAPMIQNEKQQLVKTDWLSGLKATRMAIEGAVKNFGADQVGIFVSPSATVEEQLLTAKLAKGLGINKIDSRLRQMDFTSDAVEPAFRSLGLPIAEVKALDAIFLVGADPRLEMPVLAIDIRTAVKNGAKVAMLNAYDTDQLHPTEALITAPKDWVNVLSVILKTVAGHTGTAIAPELSAIVNNATTDVDVAHAAQLFMQEGKHWIVLGKDAVSHPDFSVIRALAQNIATASHGAFGYLSEGANLTGAYLAGVAKGNTHQMLTDGLKAYILVGAIDPEHDFIERKAALTALKQAELVVALTPFASEALLDLATIILPAAAWGETDGSLMNVQGTLQTVKAAAEPLFDAKPLWKILRVLGNEFELSGFDYVTCADVLADHQAALSTAGQGNQMPYANNLRVKDWRNDALVAVPMESIYSMDAYARRSEALQATPLAPRKRVTGDLFITQTQWVIEGQEFGVRSTAKMAANCLRIPREYGLMIDYYEAIEG